MTEAEQIVADWKAGKKCVLSDLSDNVHREVERLVENDRSNEGYSLRKDAEYAWHEKYGRSGGYSGDEEQGY
jgi:hypothetical protein